MSTPNDDEVWTTLDGRKIKVGDMDVDHLRNTLRFILRRHKERVAKAVTKKLMDSLKNDVPWDS